jgi:hypothetical protein
MPLDSSPAVHQSIHLGQGRLPVVSGPGDRLGVIAEALPLGGTRDLSIEPFARVCETVELRNQLVLAHLNSRQASLNGPHEHWKPYDLCEQQGFQ